MLWNVPPYASWVLFGEPLSITQIHVQYQYQYHQTYIIQYVNLACGCRPQTLHLPTNVCSPNKYMRMRIFQKVLCSPWDSPQYMQFACSLLQ